MTQDLDNLLDLFFSSDGWWNFVSSSQPVERNTEVLQVRRQLKLLSVLFLFLFPLLNLCPNIFLDRFRTGAHVSQYVDKQTIVTAQGFEDICCFDNFATLCSRSLHGALEQVGCIRPDAKSFSDMLLPAVGEALFNRHFDHYRVER